MQIEFAAPSPSDHGTTVVLATAGGRLGQQGEQVDEASGGALRRAIALAGKRFKRGSVIELVAPQEGGLDRILIAKVGRPDEAKTTDVEALGGSVALKLRSAGVAEARILVDAIEGLPLAPPALAVALALGASLRSYRFTRYRTKKEDDAETGEVKRLTLQLDDPDAAEKSWRSEAAVVAGVHHARDLISEPANVLYPETFADACRALGDEVGLEVEVLGRSRLQELGMNAILGVAQGSVREPFVVAMRWQGGGDEAPVALVGKGVCFDSGGISLKPAGGMEDMKWDMGGAAAVFGAMKAIAGRKAKANVVGVVGLVENMPGGSAQRPGDVVKTAAGVTVEVINTDAEGRLVLADVLHYVAEHYKPKAMVDLATLTGAIIVALGHEQAGLFTNDEGLAGELEAAGTTVGEKVWRMPLGEAYAEHIKSDIADIKNVGRAREAGATAGAIFLARFAGDVPWAHLDIAGVTFAKRDLPLAGKGATAFGVRLLDRWLRERDG
jgi:leucyl aminopeptidase